MPDRPAVQPRPVAPGADAVLEADAVLGRPVPPGVGGAPVGTVAAAGVGATQCSAAVVAFRWGLSQGFVG